MVFFVLFVLFGWANNQMVTLNVLVLAEPAQLQMSQVIALLLAVGFLFGMLASFYVISRLKLANALKQSKAKKQQQKLEQNQALASAPEPSVPAMSSNE